MNNEIKRLHQTLHGYNCGHHLLASSIKLSDKSVRKMEKLSDLSGNVMIEGFEQYYTGYYLAEEHYYVVACTWYAPEMNRPGCVWTHSLLIKEETISNWKQNIVELMSLFRRPQDNNSFELYEKEIVPQCSEKNSPVLDREKMKYIMWAIWGKSYPVIVPVDKANEFINELLSMLFCQYANIRKGFSFSTGALTVRKYENELLDVQMVMRNNIRSIVGDSKVNILEDSRNINKYPLWINFIYEMFIKDNLKELSEFRKEFPRRFCEPKYFSLLSKMYLALDIYNDNFNILNCLQIIDALGDDKEILSKSLIDLYLKKYNKIRINYVEFMQFMLTKEWISLAKEEYTFFVDNSLKFQMDEAKKLVKNIAYIDDNIKIETILKYYAKSVSINKFEEFTDNNIDICCLFVTLNPRFAMAECIWKQNKNFQQSILQCLRGHKIEASIIKRIVEKVILNSNVDLIYNLYSVLGDQCILDLLTVVCRQGIKYIRDNESIKKVCNQKTDVCFNFLCEQAEANKIDDNLIFIELFDPHKLEISQKQFEIMLDIFHGIIVDPLFDEYESKIARFYIVLILRSEYRFPDEILSFSYSRVYNELANQKFPQDEWEKMEYLMPEFGYHNWDRCKRLKKSLKEKGYTKKEFG